VKNPRVTPKDRNAIKGALRRAFSRSELHKAVIEASIVEYSDPKRPRVKKWARCNMCKKPEAKSYMVVDHIDPVIPVGKTFEEIGADETIDRLWCERNNLQSCCVSCHNLKSQKELKARKEAKK
jgi:5-methylcytosine-specific restriction endonuclease McrA